MKIIFFTDPHGQASNPSSRLDEFSQAILGKFSWIGKYAKEIEAAAVICGGDWIHTPDVSQTFIRKLARVVRSYPCPTFGVLGNHDIYGYNPETFERTSLGIAEGLDMFERLNNEPIIIHETGKREVALTGSDSYYDLDKAEKISDYTRSTITDGAVNIHTVHGMLVENVWPQVSHCTTLKQVMDDNPNADIILSGHEHTGYGVKVFYRPDGSKVMMCNPGSLARVTSGTGDIRKDVRIAVITIEDDDFNIELVNLPVDVARPANEVLDWERIQKEKENKEQLQNFIESVSDIDISTDLNYYEALNRLAEKEDDITEDIIQECINQLAKAEEDIKKENE